MKFKAKKGRSGWEQRINLLVAEFYDDLTPAQKVAKKLRKLDVNETVFRYYAAKLDVSEIIIMEVCNALRDLNTLGI
jgi:hypothetical protein